LVKKRGAWIKRLDCGVFRKKIGEKLRGMRDLAERQTLRLHRRFS
jgi:hypothetical protein